MGIKGVFLNISTVVLISLSLAACSTTTKTETKAHATTSKTYGEESVMSTAWYQTSGEAEALYYQGYNIARNKINIALERGTSKKPAVILDLDETVLDNSPWDALQVKTGRGYPYKWDEWVNKAEAKALPGSVDFLKYANQKGLDIYYISDRTTSELDATIKNLNRIEAPQANKDHVLLIKTGEKGKQARVNKVKQKHDIVLFIGDNLSDFPGHKGKSLKERNKTVQDEKNSFGDNFVILPNPMYGDWENALYNFENKQNQQKADLRKENLEYFDYK
ncbi:5'-nucleotidase (lipoprotein e(P4) family) [Bacillus aryabhattai]|uniref:5'-nucleotidase (Lipoprotein e(P4) family) n=1 Tax=Priestia aryabhattai TaxID=412384 RepID=A0A7W3NF79_PRIAR|nr:5'-nucleotidase, lipoprotein e(P4) family [Priestia aryabhattai]MBA9041818.1 5'-nucleotidase (lipoprotein e(P4) family) [Priestia aryabhattai]